jgi:hypothetical protein
MSSNQKRCIEEVLRELMSVQRGAVTRKQLLARGVSAKAFRHRVATGRLVRRGRGVYVDGALPTNREQELYVALLAAGECAYISHATAAELWGLWPPSDDEIEVTTILERSIQLPGICTHRSGLLVDSDVTELNGIAVTTMERAIADLSNRLSLAELGMLTDAALRRGLTSISRIAWCAERLPKAPGRSPKKLSLMLSQRVPGTSERESPLEDFVYDAINKYNLPLPAPQQWIDLGSRRCRVDFLYGTRLVVLEVDGFEFHRQRVDFDEDRARANELTLAGYTILRFTSEMSDWEIAVAVARALNEIVPELHPEGPVLFKQWSGGRRVVRSSGRASDVRSAR